MIVLVYDTKKRNPKPIPVGKSRADKLLASGRYKLWEENLSEVEIVKPKKKEVVVEAKPEVIEKATNEITTEAKEDKKPKKYKKKV